MNFEKWQALGNDYLIVEERELPWELTPARIQLLCDQHLGPGSDGILLLGETEGEALARLRIFNPDGSEAALSGNGAREAAMYMRQRGWTEQDSFKIDTAAGSVAPRILDDETCAMALGCARLSSADWPDGPPDGATEVVIAKESCPARFIDVGNPQFAIRCPSVAFVDDLNLPEWAGPLHEGARFPNRVNVSFWTPAERGIRARIFERGVGETLSSGTGATGAAVAAQLEGHASPIDVQLDGGTLRVEIGPDLAITLTGWARPVYSAMLSQATMEALDAAD